MRSMLVKSFIVAAFCSPLAICATAASAQQMGPTIPPPPAPQQQQEPSAGPAPAAAAGPVTECPGNPNPLGVSRVVEIDTTGGPGFGFQHYKLYDFLNPKEVVLTFDDGPLPNRTTAVLKALEAECTKAIFFFVGKEAAGYPDIVHSVAKAGHTVGSHTMLHKDLAKMTLDQARDEIEEAISIVNRGAGQPTAPFFRFPMLRHSPETLKYLADRNIAVFSTDIDSFDFKGGRADALIKRVMANLDKHGKGMILMHSIQPHTAQAMPELLKRLKAGGYKVVQMVPKAPVKTLPEYDEKIAKDMQGMPTALADRPLNSVVKTIGGQ